MGICVTDMGGSGVAIWIEHVYDTGMVMTELETVQHRIETRLAQVCGHLNVLHAELVALTAESPDQHRTNTTHRAVTHPHRHREP